MRPSEGVEGVVFEGWYECRQLRRHLNEYPASTPEGTDPDIQRALNRMDMIRTRLGRLDLFVLDASTVEKIADEIDENLNDPALAERNMREFLACAGTPLPFSGMNLLRQEKQRKFSWCMRQMNARSRAITHERVHNA